MTYLDNISADYLRSIIHYDPETGIFTRLWRDDVPLNINLRDAGKPAGHIHRGRHVIEIWGHKYYAHRLAWLYVYGEFPVKQIDHVNGNPLDNRISNLRGDDVDDAKQSQNRKVRYDSTTGYTGVSYNKELRNPYRAYINVGRVRHWLGNYATAEEASEAYKAAKYKLHKFQPTIRG